MYIQLADGRELFIRIEHRQLGEINWLSGRNQPSVRTMSHLTICTINDTAHRQIATGVAKCSTSDQFRRKTGALISLRRATAHLDKPIRRQIWETFMKKPNMNRNSTSASSSGNQAQVS